MKTRAILAEKNSASSYAAAKNLEIYTMGDAQTTLVNSPLIANSYACTRRDILFDLAEDLSREIVVEWLEFADVATLQ